MGSQGMPRSLDDMPDHVARMKAFRAAHQHVSILLPGQADVTRPTATWLEVDADPRVDGAAVTVRRETLGMLMDYLEACFDRD
jgi:hypothetical protein